MMLYESISEIGLTTQGHLQGQRSWSKSCKLAQALWQMSLKSAAVGFTKFKCWSFGLSLNDVVQINFCNWICDPRSYLKFEIMVEGQYTLSRSKGQAGEHGSSLGERAEITQPALQWRNFVALAFNTQVALSLNNAVETLISAFVFGPLADSLLSHPSWHTFDKHLLHATAGDGYGYEVHLHVTSHAAANGEIADRVERYVTFQECFLLTKWDAHRSVRLCSY